jgi:chromosome segregation ATPase
VLATTRTFPTSPADLAPNMKGKDALAYCRQLLFEQRLVMAWANGERLRLVVALERWRSFPGAAMSGTSRLDAERARWREEVEHERAAALERSRRDARTIEQLRARQDASEGVIAQLRADNSSLREELVGLHGQVENGEELEQLRSERSHRAAAGARAVLQEAALRSQLEAEQRRLASGSSQLLALESIAEEDQSTLRQRQTSEERAARGARDDAIAALGAARQLGRGRARLAWRAAYAYVRLRLTWERHESELTELEERLTMLQGLRDSRDALEWKVTQTKASLILMRSTAEGQREVLDVDANFGLSGPHTLSVSS